MLNIKPARSKPGAFIRTLTAISILFFSISAQAQHDSLILKNGNTIVGEIKSMDRGVLTIETDYSKSDFGIEWSGIKRIYSKSRFLISLKDGSRINGTFESRGDTSIAVAATDGRQIITTISDIVYLKGVKSDFWSRASAGIDLGLSLTKANNLRQYQVRSNFGYLADKWEFAFFYNDLRSKQDSVTETRRTEFGPNFKYFLQNDWFLSATLNFLKNTEQALKLRTTGKLGGGKYLVHTNKLYLGAVGGLSLNNESFTNGTESRQSLEAYFGAEANLFDVKDFSLLTNLYVYPSLTESGRWRTDFTMDAKYDLPLDFYFKLGGTLNFDNRPAIPGKETDYVVSFSIGWEL